MSDLNDLRLADRAYFRIKERLADLDLMPGDRLSEKELAEQFQISRTPIREALQRLHHEDLLALSPKLGWTVPQLDFEKIDQLYDFRILIERNSVLICAEQQSLKPAWRQLELIWQVAGQEQLSDPQQVGRLDECFHQTLVQAAGNAEIARVHSDITEKIRLIRRLDFTKPSRIAATYADHQAILRFIALGEGDSAQVSVASHITASKIESRSITLETMLRRGQSGPLLRD